MALAFYCAECSRLWFNTVFFFVLKLKIQKETLIWFCSRSSLLSLKTWSASLSNAFSLKWLTTVYGWLKHRSNKVLLVSASSQSLSKSPFPAPEVWQCTPCAQPLPVPAAPALRRRLTTKLMQSQHEWRGIKGGSVAEAQQPVSSQLDFRTHSRWASGGNEESTRGSLQWADYSRNAA